MKFLFLYLALSSTLGSHMPTHWGQFKWGNGSAWDDDDGFMIDTKTGDIFIAPEGIPAQRLNRLQVDMYKYTRFLQGVAYPLRTVTTATNVTTNDHFIVCTPNGGSVSLNLLSAASVLPGTVYTFINTHLSNVCHLQPIASERINVQPLGEARIIPVVSMISIVSSGTQWWTF